MNKASLSRSRYEEMRHEYCSVMIEHAQQHFIMIYAFVRDMHYRLEVEQELLMQKGILDFFLPVHQGVHAFPSFLLVRKYMPAPATRLFSLVHREIRRCQQIMHIVSVLGKQRNAD